MHRIKTLGVCLVAVFALGAVVASAASAFPELLNKEGKELVKKGVSGTGSAATLSVAGISVKCASAAFTGGKGLSTELVTGLLLAFKKCVAVKGKEECEAKSPGAAAEEIKTVALKVMLVENVANGKPAVFVKPEAGETFVELEGTCIVKTKVTGSAAGEVSSALNTLKLTHTAEFTAAGIKEVNSAEGKVKPGLKAFALAATYAEKETTLTTEEESKIT